MSGTLLSVFSGTYRDYAPLSKAAVARILAFDRQSGFGPGGWQANRNRFYTYLTQRGSDVEVRTVAVKSAKRTDDPVVKEVALASVDDPWIHVRDLGFQPMNGYFVDWTPQGFGMERYWSYERRWETEAYALRCMWKINARVVNPELLKRTRRFRYCAWEPVRGQILDFLKIYAEHPEIERLIKAGLGAYSTKVSVLRKLKKDRNFRQFFMRNADEIKRNCWPVPVIQKAYKKGISFSAAQCEIDAKREFNGMLPSGICAVKAMKYITRCRTGSYTYAQYLDNCQTMGLDLDDTKVSFPKQFEARRQAVADEVAAIRARKDAAKRREVRRQMEAVADRFQWLESESTRTFRIVLPRTEKQLSAEGKAMANCLNGSYAPRIARGDSLIVFVRYASAPRSAFVAVEYDLQKGRVAQCYGHKNSKPPKAAQNFVKRVFSDLKAENLEVAA